MTIWRLKSIARDHRPCQMWGSRSRKRLRLFFLVNRSHPGENTIGNLNRWVILKSNFEVSGLVFSCIETKFCKKILVGKLSPRSTQCTPLHRSLISKFSSNFAFFKKFANFFANVAVFSPNRWFFAANFTEMCSRNRSSSRNNFENS